MIALDTNVLVRFLVEDDPDQCRRVRKLIEKTLKKDETCFISDLVLCETVWVLSSAYRFRRAEIVEVLSKLLRARQLVFDSRDRAARVLRAFENGKGDFADYYILENAVAAGCSKVATFDRKLLKEQGFIEP